MGCGKDGTEKKNSPQHIYQWSPGGVPHHIYQWPPMRSLQSANAGGCATATDRNQLIRTMRDGSLSLGHGFYNAYTCSQKKVWKIFNREKCTVKRRSSSGGADGPVEHELATETSSRQELVDNLAKYIANASNHSAFSPHYHRIALLNKKEFWDFDLCQPLVAQPVYIQKTK